MRFFLLGFIPCVLTAVASSGLAADYVTEVQADNPIVYLRFEETTGLNAANIGSLGASHDGTYGGGITLGNLGAITGNPSNNAVQFDGSTGNVLVNSTVAASVFSDNTTLTFQKNHGTRTEAERCQMLRELRKHIPAT